MTDVNVAPTVPTTDELIDWLLTLPDSQQERHTLATEDGRRRALDAYSAAMQGAPAPEETKVRAPRQAKEYTVSILIKTESGVFVDFVGSGLATPGRVSADASKTSPAMSLRHEAAIKSKKIKLLGRWTDAGGTTHRVTATHVLYLPSETYGSFVK